MGWNGSGGFNRLFSWVADKAAGLDISSTRMDADTNDIATNGFGNCLTRDGQGQPTANLPMAGFRHTGVQNAVSRTDYSSLQQAQDGLIGWTGETGSADALTANYTPSRGAPADGALYWLRVSVANLTTTPTFAPDGQTPRVITKQGGQPLAPSDIAGGNAEIILRYLASGPHYELLNPSQISLNNGIASTGMVTFTVGNAPSGWLLLDDGTFGSATSGSSNSNSAANQALFTMLFNNCSDSNVPIFTSTGAGTTRAGQGTAAAAWAANCRMSLPKTVARALGVAGTVGGLTARALASSTGEETHLLTLSETPTGIVSGGTLNVTASFSPANVPASTGGISDVTIVTSGGGVHFPNTATGWANVTTATGTTSGSLTSSNTGGAAHNNMQPSAFLNAIIKQ